MPELPEVHTTVTGLQKVLPGLIIKDIWADMWSTSVLAKNTIKDRSYFPYFKKHLLNQRVTSVERRAKYILINLENNFTVIIHMKMTGHLMYGIWKAEDKTWKPADKNSPLNDPYNRHIRVVFGLSNGHQLAYCDSRKFGSISIMKTSLVHKEKLSHIGPEPLDGTFTLSLFKERLLKSKTKAIKTVLMDQTILAGVGNIYSDEALHRAHILPTRTTTSLSEEEWKHLYKATKEVLSKGIDFGGDSMSDYRNINGERGAFQKKHLVYLRTKLPCLRKGCSGMIIKKKINGRSGHYCSTCQK